MLYSFDFANAEQGFVQVKKTEQLGGTKIKTMGSYDALKGCIVWEKSNIKDTILYWSDEE